MWAWEADIHLKGKQCTELGERVGPRLRELALRTGGARTQEAGFTQPRANSLAHPGRLCGCS